VSAAPAAADALAYRPFREDDLPGVLRLWEEESGWGGITPERWRRWFVDRPDGPSLVMVAEDDGGRVAGQLVFAPTVVRLDGESIPAVRVGAPIVDRARRRRSVRHPEHPATRLYREGARAAAEAGFRLLYALPEHAWLPFFRWLGDFAEAEPGCLAVNTASTSTADLAGDLRVGPGDGFGAEYDALWERAAAAFPVRCGLDRGADRLRYRIGGHRVLEARDAAGALAGYAAVNRGTGLLVDVLARTPAELVPVLAGVLEWLAAPSDGSPAIREVKAMDTLALRPALDALGFAPVDYRFAFVCTALDPLLSADRIHPDRWYLTPGD
jgi:ribosomal protein S18 acetylase RimI-like enzyme